MAALREQLEEAQTLKDQAEKAKAEAEKARVKAEKERDEVKQKGYDLGVAETKETQRSHLYVIFTTPRLGMKPLTELKLRLLLS